jgi:hypothetical protein
MPTFSITTQDGAKYKVTADDENAALDAVNQAHPTAPPSPDTGGTYKEPPIALEPGERVLSLGEPKKPAPSAGESLARGVYQGATFGFGDRVSALEAASGMPEAPAALGPINTLYNMGRLGGGVGRRIAETLAPSIFGQGGMEAYNKKFAEERAADEANLAENPASYTAGSLMGGLATIPLAPSLAPFKIAEGAPLVARAAKTIGNLATGGAGYGAVSGVGSAPDYTAPASDLVENVGKGAAVGAAAGVGLGVPLAGVAKVGGMVAQDIAARTRPQGVADAVVARNLAADNPQGAIAAAQAAKAEMEAARAQPIPQPTVLSDVAGPKTQALAGTVARSPGPGGSQAKTFLEQRHLGVDPFDPAAADSAAGRINDMLEQQLGDKSTRTVAEKLIADRRAAAKPLHDAAHIVPVNYDNQSGQELLSILNNKVPNGAKGHANELLRMSGEGGKQIIWTKNAAGEFELTAVPNMRQWDYIQQGMRQYIKEDAAGQYTPKGKFAAKLQREINDLLKQNNPAYKAAKEKYAGDTDMMDALALGKDALKKNAGDVEHEINSLSTAGEKEMYRIGAAEAYRLKIENAPRAADMVKQIFNDRGDVKRLRAIAPDTASFEAMRKFLARESGMFKTAASSIGGSQTAERHMDDLAAGAKLAEGVKMLAQAGSGYIWGLSHTIFQNLARVHPERRAAVMEAARRVTLNPNPQAIQDLIDRLNKSATSRANRDAIISAITRGIPRGATTEIMGSQR